ncbi:MAG: ferritin family protein [candidate division Zixibacteria bacterium]|nr:ferritin family protein [candidate division Zixibacteria bacterium]
MTDDDKKIDEILKLGIATEINGGRFYDGFAKLVTHEEAKQKLERLASDEVKHRKVLENIYNRYFKKDPTDIPEKGIGVFARAFENRKLRKSISAPDLLDMAIEAESASHDFYAEGAKSTSDEKVKEVFLRLADEEDSHYNILMAEKSALSGLDWFMSGSSGIFEH